MGEDQFEWDDVKARSNLAKHGVTFEAACRVFDDVSPLTNLISTADLARSGTSSQEWSTAFR